MFFSTLCLIFTIISLSSLARRSLSFGKCQYVDDFFLPFLEIDFLGNSLVNVLIFCCRPFVAVIFRKLLLTICDTSLLITISRVSFGILFFSIDTFVDTQIYLGKLFSATFVSLLSSEKLELLLFFENVSNKL